MEKVLITGGTGLVGTAITRLLIDNGYEVAHLSRRASQGKVRRFLWDVDKGIIEPEAITFADHIIHLAGAGVFDERWTDAYKKELIDSRIKSTMLLENAMSASSHIKTFISASAIGYYGLDTGDQWMSESAPKGNGFLSDLTYEWENAVNKIHAAGMRTVIFRVGIVLSEKGGALPQMATPVKYFAGSALGSGKQYVSWIHIDDLAASFLHALRNPMQGVYNAAATEPVTNAALTKAIGKVLHKPVFLPPVPGFVLGLILGQEKAKMVVGGNRVSNAKLKETGFVFQYSSAEEAVKSLLVK